ncbi:unnamed protein product [Musa textilis]
MKFEKDESGRIAILPFYLYVMRTVLSIFLLSGILSFFIQGFLQKTSDELECYILRDLLLFLLEKIYMSTNYILKFFIFCIGKDRRRSNKMLLENLNKDLTVLNLALCRLNDGKRPCGQSQMIVVLRVVGYMFLALDKDHNGTISKQDLKGYADGTLTEIFIERGSNVLMYSCSFLHTVFDEHVRRSKTGGGNAREMDFEGFLDFVLALQNKDTPEGLTYIFKSLDLQGRGYLTTADIYTFFRDVHQKWIEGGNYGLCIEDVRDEIWDMVKPVDPLRITLSDLLACKQGGTVAGMLMDVCGFWAHDNRENLLQEEEELEEE